MKIYILIYCANADFSESKDELDFIKNKIQSSNFDAIHKEFDMDNDYQSLEKIKSTIDRFSYTKDETEVLKNEMKELFNSDENFDPLEQNMFLGLKNILS
ncbi:MAG: hypothetical protein P8H56_13845 [Crocinitomicaceae bacterium]|jgi:hypothetical protein|nr:hypothetical protein [Crocinitomicaceae bacterium]